MRVHAFVTLRAINLASQIAASWRKLKQNGISWELK